MTKKKSEGAAGAESTGAGVDPAIASMTYEQAVKALEELVSAIEQGEVGLEESLTSCSTAPRRPCVSFRSPISSRARRRDAPPRAAWIAEKRSARSRYRTRPHARRSDDKR